VTPSILALEKDLFFSVKIHDTLRHQGWTVTTARTLHAFLQHLEQTPHSLVIVNIASTLDWETAIYQSHARSIPVLAFGAHTDLDARSKALTAGAQKVVANSKFTSDMVGLVQRMTSNTPSPIGALEDSEIL